MAESPGQVSKEQVVGVLLAGGLARRMGGGDKCLLPLGAGTLLSHVRDRLSPQVGAVVLNANGDLNRFADFRMAVVPDSVEGHAGPLAGVLSGMIWARSYKSDVRYVVTAATDTPFFPEDLVERFLVATGRGENTIVLASSGGRVHPVFGLWPVDLAEDLDEALRKGTRKVLEWTGRHDQREVVFDDVVVEGETIDPFFNANFPEDLERADALVKAGVA